MNEQEDFNFGLGYEVTYYNSDDDDDNMLSRNEIQLQETKQEWFRIDDNGKFYVLFRMCLMFLTWASLVAGPLVAIFGKC